MSRDQEKPPSGVPEDSVEQRESEGNGQPVKREPGEPVPEMRGQTEPLSGIPEDSVEQRGSAGGAGPIKREAPAPVQEMRSLDEDSEVIKRTILEQMNRASFRDSVASTMANDIARRQRLSGKVPRESQKAMPRALSAAFPSPSAAPRPRLGQRVRHYGQRRIGDIGEWSTKQWRRASDWALKRARTNIAENAANEGTIWEAIFGQPRPGLKPLWERRSVRRFALALGVMLLLFSVFALVASREKQKVVQQVETVSKSVTAHNRRLATVFGIEATLAGTYVYAIVKVTKIRSAWQSAQMGSILKSVKATVRVLKSPLFLPVRLPLRAAALPIRTTMAARRYLVHARAARLARRAAAEALLAKEQARAQRFAFFRYALGGLESVTDKVAETGAKFM